MTQTMWALEKSKPERGLALTKVPVPEAGPDEVRIRIKKTAICGTDLHIYNWDAWAQSTIPVPMVTGHEYVGVIDQVGSHVKGWNIGDRVSGEGHITCGVCRNCRAGSQHLCRKTIGVGVNRQGCFAEYLVIPASNVYRMAPEIPDDIAAIFDPFGNAAHTALSFPLVGEDVLITGAGPIGIMAAAIAKYAGARHIVVSDVNPYRLELAGQLGATRLVDVRKENLRQVMKDIGMREGFDVGLEMSGNGEAFRSMLDTMNHGGKIAMLGIFSGDVAINWSEIIFKGLHLKGIYGREMYETWYKMTAMLQSGLDISKIITHRFHFREYESGFAAMKDGKSGKVILNWEEV